MHSPVSLCTAPLLETCFEIRFTEADHGSTGISAEELPAPSIEREELEHLLERHSRVRSLERGIGLSARNLATAEVRKQNAIVGLKREVWSEFDEAVDASAIIYAVQSVDPCTTAQLTGLDPVEPFL